MFGVVVYGRSVIVESGLRFVRTFVSITLFPLALLAALFSCWGLLGRQVEPGLIVGLVSVLTIVIVALAERIFPYRRDWLLSHQDVRTDIFHNLLNSYGFRELYKIGLIAVLLPLVIVLSEGANMTFWPERLPLALQVVAALAIAELALYWVHRLCHENSFFWRFHMVHHSPKRLYWLNAGRDHPLGVLLFVLAGSTPLIVMGAPADVMTYYFIVEAVHGLFQHANIQLRFGLLNYFFSTAALHRWHHSNKSAEANHNYGQTLILWDLLFRTYHHPRDRIVERVGLEGMADFPSSFGAQMLAPFRPYSAFESAKTSAVKAPATQQMQD
ncbi:MAG: sterol desaturase/sphingolipid hydroxylase (fatty acid hydroxylase superfamily) [Bermanella sp.]